MAGAMRLCGQSRRSALVVVAGALLGACSAGGGNEASPAPSSSAEPGGRPVVPDPGSVDVGDVEAVADAVALTVAVRDGADSWPGAGAARAARWFERAPATSGQGARPDEELALMADHRARDVVDHLDRAMDDPVADTEWLARRQRSVTAHPEGVDGWSGPSRTVRFWLELARGRDGAWLVRRMRSRID